MGTHIVLVVGLICAVFASAGAQQPPSTSPNASPAPPTPPANTPPTTPQASPPPVQSAPPTAQSSPPPVQSSPPPVQSAPPPVQQSSPPPVSTPPPVQSSPPPAPVTPPPASPPPASPPPFSPPPATPPPATPPPAVPPPALTPAPLSSPPATSPAPSPTKVKSKAPASAPVLSPSDAPAPTLSSLSPAITPTSTDDCVMGMGAAHQENYYKRRAASSYPLVDSPVILKKRAVDIKECNQAATSSCSIYRHLHALEMDVNKRPLTNYAETVQKEVTNQMREILVDWLVEVTEEFKLVSDTLYLAVSCVDRFLSIRPLDMKHLQLLGVSSILIASKQGDISPPHAQQLCFMTDNTYTVSEVIQMEKDIFVSLNSDLGYPTSKTFLRIFMGAGQTDFQHSNQQLEFLACYLLELCLLCSKCVKFLPSIAAASALFLSRFIIQPNHHPWNPMLQCQTGYKPPELQECVFAIHDVHSTITVCPLQAVREKYLQPKFTCVASLTAGEIPASYFEPIDE